MTDERRTALSSTARLAPDDIANRAFSSSFRGLSEAEVRSFLRRVAEELQSAQVREQELRSEAEDLRERLRSPKPLDESELLEALGEETAKLLRSAREAAKDIRGKAEETGARLRAEAAEEAQSVRTEAEELLDRRTAEADAIVAEMTARAETEAASIRAEADRYGEEQRTHADRDAADERERAQHQATTEIDEAKTRGRAMLEEARSLRERVLADLAHRRGLLQGQIAELRSGRDHLLEAYRVVKRTFLDATEALAHVEARAAEGRPTPVDPADIEAALHSEEVDEAAAGLAESVEADEPVVAAADSDDEGSDADDGDEHEAPSGGRRKVGDLFARIRAEAVPPPESPAADDDVPPEATEPSDEIDAPEEMPAPALADTPATRLAALADTLVRPSKRTAQDEQNELLDTLRRQKSRPTAESVLPAEELHVTAWVATIGPVVGSAYGEGAALFGSITTSAPEELVGELARQVIAPLRDRLATAVEVGEPSSASDRVNARYREWKGQQLEGVLGDVVAAAYVRGVFDHAGETARLHWVLAGSGCCADCADNALEPVAAGQAFPTGHAYPPAHAGCRCMLAIEVEPTPGE